MGRPHPKYPIFIPSKGRSDQCLTADCFIRDGVEFSLVVEPQEAEAYATKYPTVPILVLPFSNLGSVIPARNWIKKYATSLGAERHHQWDDNCRYVGRRFKGRRIECDAGIALRALEDFTDRYENIAISGLNYYMFAPDYTKVKPFFLNCHVYSTSLILNSRPYEFRGPYNEDTDYCLQALADGWCTVLLNVFLAQKQRTMTQKGGNTTELYGGDGRLKMARSLERRWPGVVETDRRFGRPQHVVNNAWKKFDTPLRLKPGVDLAAMKPDNMGMKLTQVAPEIKSDKLRRFFEESVG